MATKYMICLLHYEFYVRSVVSTYKCHFSDIPTYDVLYDSIQKKNQGNFLRNYEFLVFVHIKTEISRRGMV